MSEKGASVALLFDDAELGGHLRAALSERGARIVHEGPLGKIDQAMLAKLGADVLVVNLDDDADDDALDHIYGLAESGNARVVFNDAEASRGLDGWDRARWARHLAFKALETGDFDPPRPQNASTPEAIPADDFVDDVDVQELGDAPSSHLASADLADVDVAAEPAMDVHTEQVVAESETLAAELEALLAAGDESNGYDEFGSGLKFDAEAELPPLHDGNFGAAPERGPPPLPSAPLNADASAAAAVTRAQPPELPASAKRDFQLDHLALAPIDEIYVAAVDAANPVKAAAAPSLSAPSWDLLDDSEVPAEEKSDVVSPVTFGIEKVSAAEYLAPPSTGSDASPLEPGLSLELVSLEDALAPSSFEPQGHEIHLGELESFIGRMLVLGAARDSFASVCAFLSALPITLRAPILLTQHLGDQTAEQLAQALSAHSTLPVKVAAVGTRAKSGQILLVPRGQQLRLKRDGQVDLTPTDAEANSPSIDSSFTMVANVFGRDALAIVFAGQATDGVAGAQAIHDRGGRVWVESSPGDHYTDIVHGVMAERLTSFSGSPQELVARLIEDFQ